MAQLVHLQNREDSSDEGVVIDTEDTLDKKLEAEYDMKIVSKVRLPEDCIGMPCDRLLVAE